MSPVALKKAFELYTEVRLIVVAHLYGTPGKMEEIKNPMLKGGLKLSCGCYASDKAKKTMIIAHTKRTVVERLVSQ